MADNEESKEFGYDSEQSENKTEATKERRTAIGINSETREKLMELRCVYILHSWDDAINFLVDNMKKVPRPKSKFFD